MLLKQDGLILSPSMVDDWHQGVCDKIEPLYNRDLDACKRAAMMYSLFGACKVLDKNPERWPNTYDNTLYPRCKKSRIYLVVSKNNRSFATNNRHKIIGYE